MDVELSLEAADPTERRREPVTCGLPWPRGLLPDPSRLTLVDAQGQQVAVQAQALDHWLDGSVRWLLLDWQADVRGSAVYRARVAEQPPPASPSALHVREQSGEVIITTGAAEFRLRRAGNFPFDSIAVGTGAESYSPRVDFAVEDEAGQKFAPRIDRITVEEQGPARVCVRLDGELAAAGREPLGIFEARLHFFAGSAAVRFALSLGNPRRAGHPGGLWDLGATGSVYIKDAALIVMLPPGAGPAQAACSPEVGAPLQPCPLPLELYQDSSGGENWKSHNHYNRHHVVPNTFRGYRLRAGDSERAGLRATPVVTLERGGALVAVAVRHFWQNFPKAVEATADGIVLRLFPRQYADAHELQGGEQKTHTFTIAFGRDTVTAEPLAWCRTPLVPRAAPAWYAATGAVPYLTPRTADPNPAYLQLVDAAVEGEDTFFHKREVIDEYGWRHFGDVYGDHEAVFDRGPEPLVSHYNNQYDPLAGFAYQFLRSGDVRWWALMEDLAGHVADIDIYHTDRDKSAYNHGLFWHTYHYVDADTATHRSYPRAAAVNGGGPADEHNYTTGLLLHYFLTGDRRSRDTVLTLARWVIDMDDGTKTVFRWLDRGYTGFASATASPLYHGPGRGGGNSINALLDGYRLTGAPRFLAKLEQLVRRCVHPADDVAARGPLDAERRWSYTVFLQALGRYLDFQAERSERGRMYAYARASLLHYARWMAESEYPYLDKPEKLYYPTETWVAQDMRKSEVFKYAAKHAAGAERRRFWVRADFFFRYVTTKLPEMKTRTLARPVILLLSYGFMHSYFQQHPDEAAPPPAEAISDFGRAEAFVPQKVRAKRRFLGLCAGLSLGLIAIVLWLLLR
jgi:hypothetical protein